MAGRALSRPFLLSLPDPCRNLTTCPSLVRPPPAEDLPLPRDAVLDLQSRLQRLGLYTDEIDGLLGPRTRAAIRDFQVRAGLVADGYPTQDMLGRLRTAAP